MLLTMLPVGLDFLVSTGDLQNPVTCSAVFSRFSISKEFVLDVNFMPPMLSVDNADGFPFSRIRLTVILINFDAKSYVDGEEKGYG